jgi:hypothetical protein
MRRSILRASRIFLSIARISCRTESEDPILPLLNPYFLTCELITLFAFLLCLRHAWRRGGPAVFQFFAGILFGILLELATIRQLHAYQYGQFTVMLLDVPLAIGLAWGNIVYSVRAFTDSTSLSPWARPVLDALLALNIDLAMDAVAIRLGMWDWGMGLKAQYFGVPYASFWAWFWVVFSFSSGMRFLASRPGWVGRWLAPPGAVLTGLAGVLFTNALIIFWLPRGLYEVTVAAVLIAALLLVLWLRPRQRPRTQPDPLEGQVSLLMHGYFLIAGVLSGVVFQPPILFAVSLLMLAIAFFGYHQRWVLRLIGPSTASTRK